jgi:hypothetical protein
MELRWRPSERQGYAHLIIVYNRPDDFGSFAFVCDGTVAMLADYYCAVGAAQLAS